MSNNTMHRPIRKAVFPVAGLGTRFLPATKVVPKELLPIVDRPLIQYAVDEAREAGIEQMIFVTGRGKTALVENFDIAYELENTMTERGKDLSVLDPTRFTPGNLMTVRQQVPLGLGHAIWCARAIVGDEPFAVLLPDELMVGRPGSGCMKQMIDAYNQVGGNLVSVIEVPHEEVSSYGVIAPGATSGRLTEVTGLVEKPKLADAPSNKIITGRYILQPEVMRVLDRHEKGAGGEIQLTDAMARMIGTQPFNAVNFDGRRFDCGSKTGFVEATLALALEREDMGAEVRRIAERLLARWLARAPQLAWWPSPKPKPGVDPGPLNSRADLATDTQPPRSDRGRRGEGIIHRLTGFGVTPPPGPAAAVPARSAALPSAVFRRPAPRSDGYVRGSRRIPGSVPPASADCRSAAVPSGCASRAR